MADVIGCCCPSLISSSTWSATAASRASRRLEIQKPAKKNKLKLHRTWTPGRRVSKDRYVSKELDISEAAAEESGDPIEQEMLGWTNVGEAEDVRIPHSQDERDEGDEVSDGMAKASELNCRHFSRCSGCLFESRLNGPPVYSEAVEFFRKRHIDKLQLIPSATRGWRCRAKLAVRGTSEIPLIGLFEEHSHNIVDIPDCCAHHPTINIIVEVIKAVIRDLGVQPYDEVTHSGQLRYIQVVVNTYVTSVAVEERYKSAKVQVSLVWNSRDEDSPGTELLHKMAYCLWRRAGPDSSRKILHSVWANFQTTQTNIILGQRWRRLFGEQELWERVGGVDICYAPSDFGQANYKAFEALLRRLQKYVNKGSAVTDLFAGVGVIGLGLAAKRGCRIVKCVEVNRHCQASFERSLTRLHESVDCQISWHCADASEIPITWLEGSDVVIVDPPRKGLQPALIDALRTASVRALGKSRFPSPKENEETEKRPWVVRAKDDGVRREGSISERGSGVWPEQLIYVSCGWESFKQDCEALEDNGHWHLTNAHAFNFFPGTDSIEILAVFQVGKRIKNNFKNKTRASRL